MTAYRNETTVIDAIQFTGGPESTAAVTEWATPHGYTLAHRQSVNGHNEYLTGSSSSKPYLHMEKGEWLISTPQGRILTSPPEQFEARYKIAEGYVERAPDDRVFKLGDWVKFTGTVKKDGHHWQTISYEDAPLPGFPGYKWANGWDATFSPVSKGFITGKRIYRSMENDEGIWVPDGAQTFTAYLVAWHLSRKPVIVRLDQILREEEAVL